MLCILAINSLVVEDTKGFLNRDAQAKMFPAPGSPPGCFTFGFLPN